MTTGSITLTCAMRDGRSYIPYVRYDGLARVSRARHDGSAAHVVVAHLGPGILGGDAFTTSVDVEADAALVVGAQMALPVFAGSAASTTRTTMRIARNASLVFRSEPLMLDANAQHDAEATVDAAGGALAIVADVVVAGSGAVARMRTTARIDGRLVLRDACDLRAGSGAVATVLVVCDDELRRAAMSLTLERVIAEFADVRAGLGATGAALVLRALSPRVWALQRLVDDVVTSIRSPEPLRRLRSGRIPQVEATTADRRYAAH